MDPTALIAPTPFPNVVTSLNDQPLYGVTEHLPDGTISFHLNYLYKGRNLVGSDILFCQVFVAADKGAQDVHAIIGTPDRDIPPENLVGAEHHGPHPAGMLSAVKESRHMVVDMYF
ncbi:MAG: hypothetical protein J3Q66DRAFT_391113 [Benniella sp.]|nr:MAG: hypothetical protein J3Q66DRAFT_391113 [Benniella sp.]